MPIVPLYLTRVAPLKTKKRSCSKTTPWMNENIHDLKRSCRKAERTWRKTKLQVHRDILKEKIANYNRAVWSERTIHFSKVITENSGNSRMLFSTIDRLLQQTHAQSGHFYKMQRICRLLQKQSNLHKGGYW